jgi:hypothetical protein
MNAVDTILYGLLGFVVILMIYVGTQALGLWNYATSLRVKI